MKITITILFILFQLFANSTNYYVKTGGNDSNTGLSDEQAWATITKVNAVWAAQSFAPGDSILFKRGDSFEGTITVGESGTSASRIVVSAYGTGAKPKIHGSKVVTGWTIHSGNIYKATVDETDISQLFLDGDRMRLARYPNGGYIITTGTNGTSYVAASSGLDPGLNYGGAKIFLRNTPWTLETESVTSSSGTTLYISKPYYTTDISEGFFMNNKLVFLDEAGEWFYDTATKTVYLWTPNGDTPANYTVRGSIYDTGIYGSYKNYITIDSLNILHQKLHGIYFYESDYLTISNCDIYAPALNGIYLHTSRSDFAVITDNVIDGSNQVGMYIQGSNHLIEDNVIKNIAKFENLNTLGIGHQNRGTGLYLEYGGVGGTVVRYNTFTDIAWAGIHFYDCPNTLIEYNYIYNSCYLKDDGGAIYTYCGSGTATTEHSIGSIIRYNIIDLVPGAKTGSIYGYGLAFGIYMDQNSNGITINNNVTVNTCTSGVYWNMTYNSSAEYNTIYNGGWYGAYSTGDARFTGNSFTNNIVYQLLRNNDNYRASSISGQRYGNLLSWDNNTYLNKYSSTNQFYSTGIYYDYNTWKSITGQDANSTVNYTALPSGHGDTIIYNTDKDTIAYDLNGATAYTIAGATVADTFQLLPFTGLIMTGENLDNITLLGAVPPNPPEPPTPDPEPEPNPDPTLTPSARGAFGVGGKLWGINGVPFGIKEE